MRRWVIAAVLVLAGAAVATAASSVVYQVRVTPLGSLPIKYAVGNPCDYGFLPGGVSAPWTPAPDATTSYQFVSCVKAHAKGIYADAYFLMVPVHVAVTRVTPAPPPPTPKLEWDNARCAATFGAGFIATPDGKSCVPSNYYQ